MKKCLFFHKLRQDNTHLVQLKWPIFNKKKIHLRYFSIMKYKKLKQVQNIFKIKIIFKTIKK